MTIILGSTAPTLAYGLFTFDYSAAKTVTVKVPPSATGYGEIPKTYSGTDTTENWGNGFRGGGWTGTAFQSADGASSIVTNITLHVVYQD
jgi:hypothetical protein